MYSLYRAWFGGGENCAPLAPLETLSPPDTIVRVGSDGEHQFVAHRGVLAAHSGYLKALLATASTATSTPSSASSGGNSGEVTSLSVSSVGGEAFAPLLNYMYTGRLEVTMENIYSVLLATHLLHMPGALEQCRAALLRLRAPPHPATTTGPGGVLRPVPNRLVGPPLCWPQAPLYPSGTVGLQPLQALPPLPPALTTIHSRIIHESRGTPYSRSTAREKSISPKPSTSQVQRTPRSPSRSVSVEHELTHEEEEPAARPQRSLSLDSDDRISVTDTEPPPRRRTPQRTPGDPGDLGSTSTSSVVIDIACCDGPVRFHRVLNANYTPGPRPQQQQRVFVEEVSTENDENGQPEGGPDVPDVSGSGSYTCSYCSHTFKSHYCYQKHARRHLHPTEADGNGTGLQGGRKREVRLLDLNVQYYPCKICGSKFPSYYFVHKHRKLCHSNEDIQSGSDDLNVAHTSNSSNPQTQ